MAAPARGLAHPLAARVATALVLIVVAVAALVAGGLAFTALAAVATLIMFAEWAVMHRLGRGVRRAGLALLGAVVLLTQVATTGEALVALAGGAGLIGLFVGRLQRGAGRWATLGLLYCGLPGLALIWLRGLSFGLAATLFLFICTWATDIAAFFTGRAIGGPKLAPAISPNKTWSGAFGGVLGAMLVGGGAAAAWLAHIGGIGAGWFVAIAGGLAGLAILGDLFESWLKRRAGVKDSGTLLPGHGGLLDRLDGLVPVAIAGAGLFRLTGWAG